MSYPGHQVTAQPGLRRRYQPGDHPSGPIGPFGPIRHELADTTGQWAADHGFAREAEEWDADHGFAREAEEWAADRFPAERGGRARHAARPQVPAPRNGQARPGTPLPPPEVPAPRRPRGRHASRDERNHRPGELDQRPGDQDHRPGDERGWTGSHRGYGAGVAPSQRGPVSGYPPRPGEPGPRYPQGQFSAWNERAEPRLPAGQHPSGQHAAWDHPAAAPPPGPSQLMASAPTWADTRGGTALADRPDDLAGYSDDLAGYSDDLAGYSDDDVEKLAAEFADATALVADEPIITPTAAGEISPATGSTRAAAAKARKAARRRGRARRRVVLAGICLPAIAAVAAMAYIHHPKGAAAPGVTARRPAHPAAAPARAPVMRLGPWQHIGTRAEDPVPLTLGQLFPAQFTADGAGYVRTAQLGSSDCASALFGARLQAAVRKYGCSQVMRASYLSAGQRLMGTIGVLNLASSADASAVGRIAGSSEFIAQLTASSGPTHNLAKGTGLEEAEVKGHYLILTWAEFTSLHAPRTAAEKAQLKAFSANLVNQTANVSLTSRMVTGDPQVP